jgi:hypothetical protein
MSLAIDTPAKSGRSFVGTVRKEPVTDGSLGDTWDATNKIFGPAVPFADASIPLTEQTGDYAGLYHGAEASNLDSFTGRVLINIHDTTQNNFVERTAVAWLLNGAETSPRSDATEANQLTIISLLSGIVPTPVSPDRVNDSRTWWIKLGSEDNRAPQQVQVSESSIVTLAMDFSHQLNPGTAISGVSAVEDISGNGLVPTDILPSKDGQQAHFTVSSLVAGTTYLLKATVSTTDGQTLTGRGYLIGDA